MIDIGRLREMLMPWLMAAVRLVAGWIVCGAPLVALVAPHSGLLASVGPAAALGLALLTGAGLVAFAWPRGCLVGALLLAAAVGATHWLWQRAGFVPPPAATPLAVIGVLALGEWLTSRVRRRLGPE